jgi:hypothetical protein
VAHAKAAQAIEQHIAPGYEAELTSKGALLPNITNFGK